MAQLNGFVKFDRKIKDWGWYTDVNTFKVFFHLVTFANYQDAEFLGVVIKRGQIARSYSTLALETGLTERGVRTALEHLKTTGEVTVNRHPKFSVFTVVNYSKYQDIDTLMTGDRQASDRRVTGDRQQIKKNKKDKNNKNLYLYARAEECSEHSYDLKEIEEHALMNTPKIRKKEA